MSKPKVFISHSGNDGVVGELIAALVDKLRADYEPMVDMRNIPGGQEYRQLIDEMLRQCDSAVVIVSRAALDSPWVRNEAGRLRDRARGRAAFARMPVYIEGTGPADLRTREWDPTSLAEESPAGGGDMAVVAAEVVRLLSPVREHFLASGVERDMAGSLRRLHPETLGNAVAPLFPDPADAWTAADLALQSARRLLAADPPTVAKVLSRLILSDVALTERVLDVVLPFTWVNRDAAAVISATVHAAGSVWINTARVQTARDHVACASPEFPFWDVLDVEETWDEENPRDLVAAFRAELAHADGQFTPAMAARLGERSGPDVLAVPCSVHDLEVRAAFDATEFATYAKVFMAGEVSWGDVPAALIDALELVRPELDRDRERDGLDGCDALVSFVNRLKSKQSKPRTRRN